MIKHISNNTDFQKEVLDNSKIVLADFFAEWCGPCQMLAPVLENITKTKTDVDIVKIDIDKNMELASKYNIEVVPTLLFFKDGNLKKTLTGYMPENSLVKEFENL